MIPYIYSKWYYRLITGTFFGLLTWLLNEVALNIRYRYFEMFLQPLNYLYAALLGILIQESTFPEKYSIKDNPGKKDLLSEFWSRC
jgi:hypothetical protein